MLFIWLTISNDMVYPILNNIVIIQLLEHMGIHVIIKIFYYLMLDFTLNNLIRHDKDCLVLYHIQVNQNTMHVLFY